MGRPDASLTEPLLMALDADAWDFSLPDWEDRLRNGDSLVPDLPLDERLVRQAVGIFNKLRLPDVPGCPALADAAGDWWRDIIAALFGSVDAAGFRHVTEILCMVPKKNSKTTNAGATGVTALLMDPVPRQRYSIYGPTQEIAERGFAQAAGMIAADPDGFLQDRFHVRHHLKSIVDRVTESTLRVVTFDEKVATGGIDKGAIIDELHILGKVAHASRTLGQIRGGQQQDGAFLLMITTQSDEAPAGVFKAELAMARAIRDGRLRGDGARLLPVLYEFPEAMQTDPTKPWADPAMWHMVLPNLGRSVKLPKLEGDWLAAQEKGEAEIRRFASQHFNIEIGLALHSDRWRGADDWEVRGDASLRSLDELLMRCEVAVVGIDGGGLDDLAAVAVLGRETGTRNWLHWGHAWAQEVVFERRKDIVSTLQGFADDGDLTLCTTVDDDISGIVAVCCAVRDAGLLPEKGGIGIDPQGVGALVDALAAADLAEPQVVAIGQGYRLSSAVWSSERKLRDGTFRHGGTGLMAWSVGNAKAEQRDNAVLITKSAAGRAKIDPLVALFDAAKLMEVGPVAEGLAKPSIYETRGLIII